MRAQRKKPEGEIRIALGVNRRSRLKEIAGRLEVSESGLVRWALDAYLAQLGVPPGWTIPEGPAEVVEAARRGRSIPGFVYLIRHANEASLWKIGFSVDPVRRLNEIAKAEGSDMVLDCTIPTGDMRMLESELHQRFAGRRQRGEWFALAADDIRAVRRMSEEHS